MIKIFISKGSLILLINKPSVEHVIVRNKIYIVFDQSLSELLIFCGVGLSVDLMM
jgi:hypothetical protein